MAPTVALVINAAPGLVEDLERISLSIQGLRIEAFPSFREANARLLDEDMVLILVYLPAGTGPEEVSGLLRRITPTKRPIATLVLSERHEPEHALLLLRQGVADYLSRPLDLARLTYLLDVL